MDGRITSIVILGGGTAGWMAAAALSRLVPQPTAITLIESDQIGTVGVGEATIPPIRQFNASLGIDEDRFVRATGGSFKLGIAFEGWGAPQSRYIHAFGAIGRGLGVLPYHHYWLRHRAEGGTAGLWDASPCAQAADANRLARVEDRPGAPASGMAWAFHFDAALYAAFLRGEAEARGVMRVEGRVEHVRRDPETGFVTALALDGDRQVEGQLFIDCTGFAALLIGGALGTGFDDWSRWLPCDRALAVPSAPAGPLVPYTRSIARAAGWQWRIPLQHRTGNGLVYASAVMSDDEAAATLLGGLDGAPLATPRPLRFTAGRRRRAWDRNVVALGLASGFLEPLESTSIHLVQSGIARLVDLFPRRGFDPADIAEYNRDTEAEWTAIRDFLILHYHVNRRPEPFWRDRAAMAVPDSLAQRIALFRANGRITRQPHELFTEAAWLQVMIGQGIIPAGYHPFADRLDAAQLAEFIALNRAHAGHVAAQLPDHAAFIAATCAATAGAAAA